MTRQRRPPSQTWRTFLNNHAKNIVAIDFFTVPTATFHILYVFLVLSHDRRQVLHFNVAADPTAQWTAQQIVEAFAWDSASKYLLRDRDGIYGAPFLRGVKSLRIEDIKTAPRSPRQNPYVERLIGSIRRDCLDHIIVLNEKHLRRVLRSYLLTDGYVGYEQVVGVTGVGCWSHARRYFHDPVKARPRHAAPGLADEALAHADALFRLERGWRDHEAPVRGEFRRRYSAPVLDRFAVWLARYAGAVAPKTLRGKAIGYAQRGWARLRRFVDDGRLPLSNNATEQAIKQVVIGRKNFLFASSPAGARALANLYGLTQTAAANGLEPWASLKQVLTQLPQAQGPEPIEALLAWRLREACR